MEAFPERYQIMRDISVGMLLLLLILFDITCLSLYLRHRPTRSPTPRQMTSHRVLALAPMRGDYDTHPISPEPALSQREGNGPGSALPADTQ